MKDLKEFKEIEEEEDRKSAYEKFIKRQKVRPHKSIICQFTNVMMNHRRNSLKPNLPSKITATEVNRTGTLTAPETVGTPRTTQWMSMMMSSLAEVTVRGSRIGIEITSRQGEMIGTVTAVIGETETVRGRGTRNETAATEGRGIGRGRGSGNMAGNKVKVGNTNGGGCRLLRRRPIGKTEMMRRLRRAKFKTRTKYVNVRDEMHLYLNPKSHLHYRLYRQ